MFGTLGQYHQSSGGSFAPLAQNDTNDDEPQDQRDQRLIQEGLNARERFRSRVQSLMQQNSLAETYYGQYPEPYQQVPTFEINPATPEDNRYEELDISELGGTYIEYYAPSNVYDRAPSSLSHFSDARTGTTYDPSDKYLWAEPKVTSVEFIEPVVPEAPVTQQPDYRPFALKKRFALLLFLTLMSLVGMTGLAVRVLPNGSHDLTYVNSTQNHTELRLHSRSRSQGVKRSMFSKFIFERSTGTELERRHNSTFECSSGNGEGSSAQTSTSSLTTPLVESTSSDATPSSTSELEPVITDITPKTMISEPEKSTEVTTTSKGDDHLTSPTSSAQTFLPSATDNNGATSTKQPWVSPTSDHSSLSPTELPAPTSTLESGNTPTMTSTSISDTPDLTTTVREDTTTPKPETSDQAPLPQTTERPQKTCTVFETSTSVQWITIPVVTLNLGLPRRTAVPEVRKVVRPAGDWDCAATAISTVVFTAFSTTAAKIITLGPATSTNYNVASTKTKVSSVADDPGDGGQEETTTSDHFTLFPTSPEHTASSSMTTVDPADTDSPPASPQPFTSLESTSTKSTAESTATSGQGDTTFLTLPTEIPTSVPLPTLSDPLVTLPTLIQTQTVSSPDLNSPAASQPDYTATSIVIPIFTPPSASLPDDKPTSIVIPILPPTSIAPPSSTPPIVIIPILTQPSALLPAASPPLASPPNSTIPASSAPGIPASPTSTTIGTTIPSNPSPIASGSSYYATSPPLATDSTQSQPATEMKPTDIAPADPTLTQPGSGISAPPSSSPAETMTSGIPPDQTLTKIPPNEASSESGETASPPGQTFTESAPAASIPAALPGQIPTGSAPAGSDSPGQTTSEPALVISNHLGEATSKPIAAVSNPAGGGPKLTQENPAQTVGQAESGNNTPADSQKNTNNDGDFNGSSNEQAISNAAEPWAQPNLPEFTPTPEVATSTWSPTPEVYTTVEQKSVMTILTSTSLGVESKFTIFVIHAYTHVTTGLLATTTGTPERFTDYVTTETDAFGRPTRTKIETRWADGELVIQTDSLGNPTATEMVIYLRGALTTTMSDIWGKPTRTKTFYMVDTAISLTDSNGRVTGTRTSMVTETPTTMTLRDVNGYPTLTITTLAQDTLTSTQIATATAAINGSGTSKAEFLNIYLPSSKDYFVGLMLPILVAIGISIPIRMMDQTAKLYQPFHALTSPYGATTVDSLCLQASGPQGFIARLRSSLRSSILLALTGFLVFTSSLLIPLSSEAVQIMMPATLSKRDDNTDSYKMTVGVYTGAARAAMGFLTLMALLVAVIGVILWEWRTGIWFKPWNLYQMSRLGTNSEVHGLIKRMKPKNGRIKNKDAIKAFGKRRFNLEFWKENDVLKYGVHIKNDEGNIMIQKDRKKTGLQKLNLWHGKKRSMPFFLLTTTGRLLFLLLLFGLTAVILAYNYTDADSGFGHFMDSETFGVRFFFTGIGALISLIWGSFFISVAFMSPYRLLDRRRATKLAVSLEPPTNAFSGFWSTVTRAHPDSYLGVVSFTTVISYFLPALLANVPNKAMQSYVAHVSCTWLILSLLCFMIIVVLSSCLVHWPHMPVDPSTIAGAMYYAADPSTFRTRDSGSSVGVRSTAASK